jgi:predicted phosphodiesterase
MQKTELHFDDEVLLFGGPYSNLEATEALLAEGVRLSIPTARMICTGDLVAYCADPAETVDLVRRSGIHVVMGNCDEQLGLGAADCGCGFPEGSSCERLSSEWFAYADAHLEADARTWLAALPRRIDVTIGGRQLAVIHGGVERINQFIFASSAASLKLRQIEITGADGVIGGHCGLPSTQIISGRLWHNAGVIGMPANDGTPRVWYSVLRSTKHGLEIIHRPLAYDHRSAAAKMRKAGLPAGYTDALSTGLWPSTDVLLAKEKLCQGRPIQPKIIAWKDSVRTRQSLPAAAE